MLKSTFHSSHTISQKWNGTITVNTFIFEMPIFVSESCRESNRTEFEVKIFNYFSARPPGDARFSIAQNIIYLISLVPFARRLPESSSASRAPLFLFLTEIPLSLSYVRTASSTFRALAFRFIIRSRKRPTDIHSKPINNNKKSKKRNQL